MQAQLPKDVEETEEFSKKCQELFPDTALFDRITFAVIFAFARKPDIFPTVPGTDIQVIRVRRTEDTPPFSIFLRSVDQKTVQLLDLQIDADP